MIHLLLESSPAGGSTTGIVEYLTIFVLAAFVGIEVVSKVPSILHTPLMSGSNAIHGIVLVGALTIMGEAHGTAEVVLGFLAVFLATLNVVGGFVVTDRMLEMFKAKPGERARAQAAKAEDTARGGVREPRDRWGRRLMLAVSFTLTTARDLAYLVAIAGFIVALKGLSSPRHARLGQPRRRGGRHPGHRDDLHAADAAALGLEPRARPHRHGPRRVHRRASGPLREDDGDAPAGGHLQRRGRWRRRADLHRRAACTSTRSGCSRRSTSRPRCCSAC